jgi:hypothetical protein
MAASAPASFPQPNNRSAYALPSRFLIKKRDLGIFLTIWLIFTFLAYVCMIIPALFLLHKPGERNYMHLALAPAFTAAGTIIAMIELRDQSRRRGEERAAASLRNMLARKESVSDAPPAPVPAPSHLHHRGRMSPVMTRSRTAARAAAREL